MCIHRHHPFYLLFFLPTHSYFGAIRSLMIHLSSKLPQLPWGTPVSELWSVGLGDYPPFETGPLAAGNFNIKKQVEPWNPWNPNFRSPVQLLSFLKFAQKKNATAKPFTKITMSETMSDDLAHRAWGMSRNSRKGWFSKMGWFIIGGTSMKVPLKCMI